MSRLVTLEDIREDIRTRYDLPAFTSATWETTNQVNRMINQSIQALSAVIMDSISDEYFATYEDITTAANIDLVSMPDRCARLIDVTWLKDTDQTVKLTQADARDIRKSGYEPKSWDSWTPRYKTHGNNALRLFPTPSEAYTLRITFLQLPEDLSADDDVFEAGPGWEEWVISDVCAKLAIREEKDAAIYLSMRADAEERIRNQAPLRGDTGGNLFLDDRDQLLSYEEQWDLLTRRF